MEQLASIIWDELKRYINVVDRAEAAENLVSVLVDNDCDPEEIKSAFAGDTQIKNALSVYINADEEEYVDEEYEEEDDSNWEN
jgi:hypothetical protein